MDGLPWPAITAATGGWILAFVVVLTAVGLVLRGRLVPRQTLDDVIHDRDEWRAESRIKDAQLIEKDGQISEKDKQLGHLGEVGRNTLAILQALKTNAREPKP